MSIEGEMPDWVADLVEEVLSALEFREPSSIRARYTRPGETTWSVGLLEIAPGLLARADAGPDAGRPARGIITNADLLLVDDAFEAVERMSFGFDEDNRPCLTVKGHVEGGEVVLIIHTYPFEDGELGSSVELA